MQPCPLALVDGEAGASDLDAQLEVDDVVFAGQLPVRQCVGGQFGDGAARLLATVVVGARTFGHGGVGEVGDEHEQLVHVFFGLCLVGLQRAVGLFQAGYFGLGFVGFGAFALLHQSADLFGETVHLGEVGVEGGLGDASGLIECNDSVDDLGCVEVLDGQSADHFVALFGDDFDGKHSSVWSKR